MCSVYRADRPFKGVVFAPERMRNGATMAWIDYGDIDGKS
jgi:hypothetical protein